MNKCNSSHKKLRFGVFLCVLLTKIENKQISKPLGLTIYLKKDLQPSIEDIDCFNHSDVLGI